MSRTTGKALSTLALLLLTSILPVQSFAQEGSPVDSEGLGETHYARMHALLEKTFLKIDVVTVWLEFDAATARAIAQEASGKAYSEELEENIARRAYLAQNAVVRVRFERDTSLYAFLDAARKNLRLALEAEMIDLETYRRVSQRLSQWFGFLRERGIREGDWLYYRVRPDSLRTVFVANDGTKLLDHHSDGEEPRLALLGSYFAPKSDLREPLIHSLWETD